MRGREEEEESLVWLSKIVITTEDLPEEANALEEKDEQFNR